MKRLLLLPLFLVLGGLASFAQSDQFVRNYSYVRIYASFDMEDYGIYANEWTDMADGSNKFVFNYGDNDDVVRYDNDGNKETFIRVSPVSKGTNDSGDDYQEILCLDDEGTEITIMLFDFMTSVLWTYDDGSYFIFQYYVEGWEDY